MVYNHQPKPQASDEREKTNIFSMTSAETRTKNPIPPYRIRHLQMPNARTTFSYTLHRPRARPRLQLGLLGLSGQVGHEDIAEFVGGFVDVVAHALGTEALADDVEVEAGWC